MEELSIEGARCVRARRTRGFWRRQFDDAPTPTQRRFDVLFGVVMPVLCFYFDPIVFKGGLVDGGGLYRPHQLYAYTISAVEMVALCTLLFATGRARSRPAALAGMLLAGAAFSLAVGLAILPFSVIGLVFFLAGLLGFVPFLTAFVYLRNGWRAAGAAGRAGVGSPARVGLALVCGFVFALGAPAFVQMSVKSEVAAALADARAGRELSQGRLRTVRMATVATGPAAYDELVWEYHEERHAERRGRLAKAYAEITVGGDIEQRLQLLLD
ncbi:MAG: hypothetical protein ABW208_09890 [Pyrinomonadaceae bacterium]